jgi:hypothetical protein
VFPIVVAVGLAALIGLSVAVGVGAAREEVGKERERLRGLEWDLWIREQEIVSLAEVTGCRSCELLRRRAELHSAPPDRAAGPRPGLASRGVGPLRSPHR